MATFYKPDPNSQQVYDSLNKPLSYDQYKAAGGIGVLGAGAFGDVVSGPAPQLSPAPATAPAPPTPSGPNIPQLETDYKNLLSSSPEVTQAETDLRNFQNSYRMGQQKISDKPIPMPFITGQLASQARTAAIQELPLQQALALAQAKRQSSLEASRFSLERADKQTELARQQQYDTYDRLKQLGVTSQFFKYPGSDTVYQIDPSTGQPKGLDYNAYKAAGGIGLPGAAFPDVQEVSQQSSGGDYPASYQEYLLAKQEGFTGDYNQYQTMDANRKKANITVNMPSLVKEFEYAQTKGFTGDLFGYIEAKSKAGDTSGFTNPYQ